jgi:23S rRNA (adenine2030-N6)-methyltransferase
VRPQCEKAGRLNYRHQFHAGNFADVFKHALLVGLIRSLQRKEQGFLLVDTHAGRGHYDLERAAMGEARVRRPEWPDGIGRLWPVAGGPDGLAEYLAQVRDYDRAAGNLGAEPRFYPGSPVLGRRLMRPQDRLSLWEMHPAECAALRAELGGSPGVSIQQADGYGAMRAMLPPPERRSLVLIDPPFEAPDEWTRIAAALAEAVGRMPAAVCAIWYPLTLRAQPAEFARGLAELGRPVLAAELMINPAAEGLRGCGVAVVNPPWGFESEARAIAEALAAALGVGGPGQASLRWISPRT